MKLPERLELVIPYSFEQKVSVKGNLDLNIGLWGFGFSIVLAVIVWAAHCQFMAGHDNIIFSHKTELDKRVQEAKIEGLRKGAK